MSSENTKAEARFAKLLGNPLVAYDEQDIQEWVRDAGEPWQRWTFWILYGVHPPRVSDDDLKRGSYGDIVKMVTLDDLNKAIGSIQPYLSLMERTKPKWEKQRTRYIGKLYMNPKSGEAGVCVDVRNIISKKYGDVLTPDLYLWLVKSGVQGYDMHARDGTHLVLADVFKSDTFNLPFLNLKEITEEELLARLTRNMIEREP